MNLIKSETNNAIIATLSCVRKHPNADRLQLATVLGTQVIVGLDAKEGDRVVYFDSNLAYEWVIKTSTSGLEKLVEQSVHGNSAIANHMMEGVVVWYQNTDGTWNDLKHKSEEFLMLESKQRDEGIGDAEDSL